MSTPRCPTCKAKLTQGPAPATAPFCSARCKLADLGNWLDGRYVIADGQSGDHDSPEALQALLEASLEGGVELREEDLARLLSAVPAVRATRGSSRS